MTIELAEEPMTTLPEYARIPIRFTVDRVLDVTARVDDPGGFVFSERRLDAPYEKDYDVLVGEGPLQWPRRFDLQPRSGRFPAMAQSKSACTASIMQTIRLMASAGS